MTAAAPPVPRRRARLILAIAGLLLLLLAAVALYAARRVIAREALTGWLEQRGIASAVQVERFGLGGFTGRVQVGDPRRPDFVAEQVEVGYRLRSHGLEVTSVRLRSPALRATLHNGKMGFGALDPLIAEFMRRPPPPDAAQPRIRIEAGQLLLATDYGPVRMGADAVIEDAKLMSLDAVLQPARLKGQGFAADTGGGTISIRTSGDRIAARLDVAVTQASGGAAVLKGGRLLMTAALPYPDLVKRRDEGAVSLQANLTAKALTANGQALGDAQLAARFDGRSAGWIDSLTLAGVGSADLRAVGASLGGARGELLRASAQSGDIRWTRAGGDAVAATVSGRGGLGQLIAGDLRLQQVQGGFQGAVGWRAGRATVALTASAAGRGAYGGMGAPVAGDSKEMAAAKRALRSFRISAPEVSVKAGGEGWAMGLPQPARLTGDSGGVAIVSGRGGGPVAGSRDGALRLTLGGGGLPKVEADITRLSLADGAVTAAGRIKAATSVAMVESGTLDASGVLRAKAGAVSFTADRCASFQAARLELGVNDVEGLAGRLCPAGGPLFGLAGGDWRLAGRVEGATASAAFAQARLDGAAGPIEVSQRRGALAAKAMISTGRIVDLAPQRRFNPLDLSGPIAFDRQVLTATLTAKTPAGQVLARADLRHDSRVGGGGLDLDTGMLTFAPGGLQPAALSPLASAIGSPAQGTARFTGRFDWTAEGLATRGELSVPGLDFQSPAGAVTGLSGDIVFTSLAPLVAAPGQVLWVKGVATLAPLSDVTATFGVDEKGLTISGGEALVGGGKVIIESLEFPLAAKDPIRGVVGFEGVQLHDLVEATPFGDKVEFAAKVSGRVPFQMLAGRIHVQGGTLRAIEPGRLSINRAVLSGMSGDPTLPPATPQTANMINDLAYQALENLAFDTLDAKIDSLPEGRVGVLFHIIGKHDPPQRQSIKLTVADLISRAFMTRPVALPSNTGVNLTLDTTLNLDDLLDDFAAYLKLRGSAGVQP